MKDFVASIIEAYYEDVVAGFAISAENLKIDDSMLASSNAMWGYFELFALGLTLVYFLIEMNRQWGLEGRDLTLKNFFAPFLKLMIAIAVISVSPRLIGYVLAFNNNVISFFATEGQVEVTMDTTNHLGDLGIIEFALVMIPLLACWIISIVLSLVFQYKALMYKLELLLRVGFSPIAMADVYSGHNTMAIRWIKGLIALGLYGACFMLIPQLGSAMLTGFWTDVAFTGEGIWAYIKFLCSALVVPFAELGLLNVAKQATREVLGV